MNQMSFNPMGRYRAVSSNYGGFRATSPTQASSMSAEPGQMAQLLMHFLQAFSSLQNNWAQTLGTPLAVATRAPGQSSPEPDPRTPEVVDVRTGSEGAPTTYRLARSCHDRHFATAGYPLTA